MPGCSVDFVTRQETSSGARVITAMFAVDGSLSDPHSPSPRGLDSLAVKVDDDGAVWVTFQNYQAGRPDKVPVA